MAEVPVLRRPTQERSERTGSVLFFDEEPMSKIAFVLAAAFALAGASAAAGAAIDVPAQVFANGQASAKPVTTLKWRPVTSTWDRDRPLAGRSFGVNMPLGARGRLPLAVHILSSEEECHDDADITGVAQNRDQDFIRGGDH